MDLPGRVLVVSEDAECTRQIVDFFTLWKMEPVLAVGASEAEAALENRRVELAFCDSDLPEDGFRRVLDLTSARKPPVPVVALVHDERGYEDATLLGAFDAIPLPCQRSDVQWVVIRAMRDQQGRRRELKTRDVAAHHGDTGGSNRPEGPGRQSPGERTADQPTRPAAPSKQSPSAKGPPKAAKSEGERFYRC